MTRLIRILRIFGRLLVRFALGLTVLALVATGFLGFTESGARFLLARVAPLLSSPGQVIAIEPASPLLTGDLRASELTISDRNGIYGRVRGLRVDWSPLSLLKLKFNARSIEAASVEYLRPPLKEDLASDGDSRPFRLPVSIDIAKLELPDIAIGKEVAGRAFNLSASGSGRADNQDIVLSLAVARKDNTRAQALGDVAFVPGENRLTLKLSVDEPRDGMIANLLKLPDRPALHMDLDGTGPLSDWKGRLQAALEGKQTFSMDISHQAMADEGHRIVFEGQGDAEHLMPETVRNLFQGSTAFAFDLALGRDGRISISKGSLSSSTVSLTASGTYDPNGENSLTAHMSGTGGAVSLAVPAGKDLATLGVRSADISLTGKATAAVLDARADLQFVSYPEYRLDEVSLRATSAELDLQSRSGPVSLVLGFERGTYKDANLTRLLPGPFMMTIPAMLAADQVVVSDATIESARLGGTVSATYDTETRNARAALKLFALPAVLPEALAARTKGRIRLAASASYADGGVIDITDLDIQSDVLTATGALGLKDGGIQADLTGSLPRLDAFLTDASGSASYSLSANGRMLAPEVKASISSEKAVFAGRAMENLTVTAQGLADPKAPTATIGVEGKLGGQPVVVNVEVASKEGNISLPVIDANVGPNRFQGMLRLGSDFLPEGGVTFDLPDIGLVAALAGEKASGDLKGSARFAEKNGVSSVRIDAAGSGLGRDTLSIRQPHIALDVTDLKALAANGTVEAAEIKAGTNRVSNLKLAFDREDNTTGFDLKAVYDGKPLVVNGSASGKSGRTEISLRNFAAVPRGVALKLSKPASIVLEDGVAAIAGISVEAGKGIVTISGKFGPSLDLAVEIRNLPLNLANAIQPQLHADGTLSGTVGVKGTSAQPEASYKLALDRATVAQVRSAGLQPFALRLEGNLRQNVVQLNAVASNGDGLSLKGGGKAGIAGSRNLDLAFDGKIPLKAVAGMLASQGLLPGGNATLDVKVGGTAAQPQVTGRISSSDASIVDVRRNLTIRNIALVVDLERTRATISKLSGSLSTGGTVSVSGTVGIQPDSGFPADLKIALNKAAYVDGKVVSTVVDGALTLTGPLLRGAKIGGTLTLGRSAITIPQKLPASLAQINVKHKNPSKAVASQNADVMSREGSGGKGSSSSIALDLTISAPRIFVQGRGIDAELGGDLVLRGTASDPVISGGFKMKRGRLTILNRRLDFTSGNIAFGGDLTPTLDMAAESDSGSTTVTVTISGPANDPSVAFSSNPALPQDEVLAQLIFNQSLSRLSVLQIAQLADAVAQLAGGRSTSLFQSLRSNLGVDDLDVTSDESGQAKVKAGKYLNDRTYIQVEQGANSGSKASINLDVGRGIKLKGEAGSNGAGAAGIFYEKEY